MISHSYDVHLNPFKLCWDHEDEAYACVHFEAIPSTLIFEQNLIPWISSEDWIKESRVMHQSGDETKANVH
jgi:hypothetical protein